MAQTPFDRLLYNRIGREVEPEVVVDQDDGLRLYFFDANEQLLGTRLDATYFVVEEGEYNLTGRVPIDPDKVRPGTGMLLGFYDLDRDYVLYEIKRIIPQEPLHEIEFYAEHAAMCDLLDEVCLGKAVTNGTAGYATGKVIDGTRWKLELDTSSGTASTSFYFKSVWECLKQIAEKWHCAFKFRWQFDGLVIRQRYIQVLARLGSNRGRRFELWKDINNASVTYDDTNVCTAAYGRGKGEQVGETEDGEPTYGRRITFADVVWKKSNGDPVDKPLGQEYVENVEATRLYGRCGRPRKKVKVLENITDPEELLAQTWAYLVENSKPLFEAELTVRDLEAIYGFEHESVRVGDNVLVIVDDAGIQLEAEVQNISRDYISPELTGIQMGNYSNASTDIQAQLMQETRKAAEAASIGADTALKNPSLLEGMIDTMKTLIMSSGTNFYTDDSDGSFIWENDESTRAVKITGNGIMIAKSKTGTAWNWGTAITGEGIVADTITSGTLQAQLIRIFGSNMFYWDANNIHIFDPENSDREIRIGEYDGTHYGIGFSQDGGLTWSSALDFDGAHINSSERFSNVAATNSTIAFSAGSDGKMAANTTMYAYIVGYTGASRVTPVISSIEGAPSGMTVTKQTALEDYSVPIQITVAKGADLGSINSNTGQLKVHVTSPVKQDVILTWAKVNSGKNGKDGADGKDGANGMDGAAGADGKDGANGSNGISSATITLYQRASSLPSVPSNELTYTFSNGEISGSTQDWYRSIPDGSDPCYSTTAFVSSDGPTARITASDWTAPTMAVKNGVDGKVGKDGDAGQDGLSRADVYLYQRAAAQPAKPTANAVYTFMTGGISGQISPWQSAIPASNGNPCWMIKYTAIGNTTTVSIAPADWSTPVQLVKDGEDGKDGQNGRDGVDGKDGKDGEGTKTFMQAEEPDPLATPIKDGDLWFNTDNNNRLYRWNEATSAWVPAADTTIDTVNSTLMQAVADLDIAKGDISAIVGASYITNDQLQATITTLQNAITATANELTTTFNKTVSDSTGRVMTDISTLIRASGDGVEVGRSDSNFKTLLSNDRLSFTQTQDGSSTEVAYISDHKLYITDAQITNELAIGVGVHKLFKWRRTTNGLVLIYQS